MSDLQYINEEDPSERLQALNDKIADLSLKIKETNDVDQSTEIYAVLSNMLKEKEELLSNILKDV